MDFWLWLLIAFCFIVYVTILFVKALKKKNPSGKSIKEWLKNIVDILSGGG